MAHPIRLETFGEQVERLAEAVHAYGKAEGSLCTVMRSAVLKTFEWAFETCWKAAREVALIEGVEARESAPLLAMLRQFSMASDSPLFEEMLVDRQSLLTFDDLEADRLAASICHHYLPLLRGVRDALQAYHRKRGD